MFNNNFDINIKNFNGPIDLLLELIKKKKTDIFDINLVELANDYLRIIEENKTLNIELAAEYLYMAANLLQMKANLVLVEKEEENPELVEDKNKLLYLIYEYQQFKENIAPFLEQKINQRQNIYFKKPSLITDYANSENEHEIEGNSTVNNFKKIISNMLLRLKAEKIKSIKMPIINVNPQKQKDYVKEVLHSNEQVRLQDIALKMETLHHFITTLITILDMSNKEEVYILQENQNEDIYIRKGENFNL